MDVKVKVISDVTPDAPYVLLDHAKLRSLSKMYDRRIEFDGCISSNINVDLTGIELGVLEEIVSTDKFVYSDMEKVSILINVMNYMNIPEDIICKMVDANPDTIILDWYHCILHTDDVDVEVMSFIEKVIKTQDKFIVDIFDTPTDVLNSDSDIIHKFIAKQLYYKMYYRTDVEYNEVNYNTMIDKLFKIATECKEKYDNKTDAENYLYEQIGKLLIDIINSIANETSDFEIDESMKSYIKNNMKLLREMAGIFESAVMMRKIMASFSTVLGINIGIDTFSDKNKLLELLQAIQMMNKNTYINRDISAEFKPEDKMHQVIRDQNMFYDNTFRFFDTITNKNAIKNIIKYSVWMNSKCISKYINTEEIQSIIKSLDTMNIFIQDDVEIKLDTDIVLCATKTFTGINISVKSVSPVLLCFKFGVNNPNETVITASGPDDIGRITHTNSYSMLNFLGNPVYGGSPIVSHVPIVLFGSKINIHNPSINKLTLCYAEKF